MAKSNYMTTIAIDTNRSAIHFYSMVGNDKSSITHNIKSYAGVKLDENFFDKFKDAVKEVNTGYECGIGIENYNDIKENDVIECFTMEEIQQ